MRDLLAAAALSALALATPAAAQAPAPPPAAANPLLRPWSGPHGGVPPFDQVRVADFQPALEAAMAENSAEIARIADNPAPPSFDNTILALERSGRTLDRVGTVWGVWQGNRNGPEVRAASKVLAPRLSAHGDSIVQNGRLFARIDAVYKARARLNPEQQRLVWVYWNRFTRAGANLTPEQKAQLSKYNQELASLYTTFGDNELADEESYTLVLSAPAELAGLPQSERDAAAAEAVRRRQPGRWVIANTRSSMEPFLTYADDRALREKGFRMWAARGDNGDAHDNNAIVTRILAVRAAKAKLLGFPTFAHYRLADAMAKTPDAAMNLMLAVWEPAKAAVRRDVAEMQAIADADMKAKGRPTFSIAPWDYRYYAEKLRKAKYDLDLNEIKPYLQLDQHPRGHVLGVLRGSMASQFKPRSRGFAGLSIPQGDRLRGARAGAAATIGLLVLSTPTPGRASSSGAWMNAYRDQQYVWIDGRSSTIVSNNSNFIAGRARASRVTMVGWEDARTMFHEFGHAIHGLNSNVTYPSLSGTNDRSVISWSSPPSSPRTTCSTPEVLKPSWSRTTRVEPIPKALLERLDQARRYLQPPASSTGETQASALVDMKLHLAGRDPHRPQGLRKVRAGRDRRCRPQMVMRHRIPAVRAHLLRVRATPPVTTATSGPRCWSRTRSTRSARRAAPTIRPPPGGCAPRS